MARARNIKPGFFVNDELVELPFETRLLFAGLWTLADREGRLEDRPKKIKMAIFPADDLDVNESLQQLHDAGLIVRYVVEDKRFLEVLKFVQHQNPHVKEAASVIPAPDKHGTKPMLATPLTSSLIPDFLSSDSPIPQVEEAGAGYLSGRAGIPRMEIPVNEQSENELNNWLDAVAKVAGLKRRQNLAQLPKWVQACMKAISEEYALDDLLSVYRSELVRVGKDTQFLTPEGILQKLQSSKIKAQPAKWTH